VYEALEQREHQANCGRDRACDGWEAERSRIFGRLGAALARLAGGAIDGDGNGGCALAAVEAGEHAVGGGISGDLEEPVELVSLLVAERCIAEDALALLDHADERVVLERIDHAPAAQAGGAQALLDAGGLEPERADDASLSLSAWRVM
jgi:hypothetical protein